MLSKVVARCECLFTQIALDFDDVLFLKLARDAFLVRKTFPGGPLVPVGASLFVLGLLRRGETLRHVHVPIVDHFSDSLFLNIDIFRTHYLQVAIVDSRFFVSQYELLLFQNLIFYKHTLLALYFFQRDYFIPKPAFCTNDGKDAS